MNHSFEALCFLHSLWAHQGVRKARRIQIHYIIHKGLTWKFEKKDKGEDPCSCTVVS